MATGRIWKALSGFYYVPGEDGSLCMCRARGQFRHRGITPLVGDLVTYSPLEGGKGWIEEILPRKNCFSRPAVANIDQIIFLCSGAIPVTDPFLIDRFTFQCSRAGCGCVIAINKWDLSQPREWVELYTRAGFPVVCLSAKTGQGVEELRELMAGKVSAFTGNSGVGKSSLLNALDPALQLGVGEVSEKLGRGKHTTRHVELFSLPGGAIVADTPGFSSFDTEEVTWEEREELAHGFLEFRPFLDRCRFVGCTHEKEKGCAVVAAVERGEIAPSRHQSYLRLLHQAKERRAWQK